LDKAVSRKIRAREIETTQRDVFMDKKLVGVIGAIGGLATLDSAAQATPAATPDAATLNARSYAELLNPIPNAVAALRAADAAAAARAAQDEPAMGDLNGVQVAGYRHHHHHHHHHRAVIRVPLPRVIIRRGHHHHHHHHHHNY
jgi:hypothetical protein